MSRAAPDDNNNKLHTTDQTKPFKNPSVIKNEILRNGKNISREFSFQVIAPLSKLNPENEFREFDSNY